MICQHLTFQCTREEEHRVNSMLKLIYLNTLDDKSKPSRHLLDSDCDYFNQHVIDLTIPLN